MHGGILHSGLHAVHFGIFRMVLNSEEKGDHIVKTPYY
jgi:hypothetical protein